MTTRAIPTTLILIALAVTTTAAQVQVDKRRPAPKKGHVAIDSDFGSVTVTGWDREEVTVTGLLAAGAEGLDLSSDREETWIGVSVPDSWRFESDDDNEYRSTLEIHVPLGSSLGIQTLNASVTVSGVSGSISVETTNGAVSVGGNPHEVEIEAITGAVEVKAVAASMEVETVSGAVTLSGAAGEVRVNTVSGPIDLRGADLQEVDVETTAGTVRFQGAFRPGDGGFEVETFSGDVELALPADVAARFQIRTFNGKIENEIGPRPRRDGRFDPYQEVRFATAETDFDCSVSTYSGNITLRVAK